MVLIDHPKNGYSHLVASSIDELHSFAEKINIKRCWYSNKKGKNKPHYDINENMFKEALKAGAKLVSSKEIVIFLKNNYPKIF